MRLLSKNVWIFLNFQQKILLMIVEVDVNRFFHYCNTLQKTNLDISVRYNESLKMQCGDNKDILNFFFVISKGLGQRFKGFRVRHSIFGRFRKICLIWWWNVSSHTPTASLDRRVPAQICSALMWHGSLG